MIFFKKVVSSCHRSDVCVVTLIEPLKFKAERNPKTFL